MLKILPIMLCCTAQKIYSLCSIFIPQFPCFANKLALLWANSKYICIAQIALLKRINYEPILIFFVLHAITDCSIRVYRSFLQFK